MQRLIQENPLQQKIKHHETWEKVACAIQQSMRFCPPLNDVQNRIWEVDLYRRDNSGFRIEVGLHVTFGFIVEAFLSLENYVSIKIEGLFNKLDVSLKKSVSVDNSGFHG